MDATTFVNTFGKPQPGTGVALSDLGLDGVTFLEQFQREIGGGLFLDGMLSVGSRRETGLDLSPWLRLLDPGARHFGTTGFGDMLFLTSDANIVRVRTQYGDVVIAAPPGRFFDWLTEPRNMSEVLNYGIWDARCASLRPNEVLSFTPALALGGSGSWETLQPIAFPQYLALMSGLVLKEFSFPSFPQPTRIDETRSWTAEFDSYDQRHDDCFYRITLWEGERQTARFYAVVSLIPAANDWRAPAFADHLRQELERVAKTGRSNTTYDGAVIR